MGDELQRKRAKQFKTLGDRAIAKIVEPGLWSSRPDVLATDCVFSADSADSVGMNDELTLEAANGKVRALRLNRDVGTMNDAPAIYAAIVERGGVVKATVHECSVFAGFTARIREEPAR
jgi:hypothetical protein